MTQKVVALRQEVYGSAAQFHGAMAAYFAGLNNKASDADIDKLKRAARETGIKYNAALVALLKHLQSVPRTSTGNREAEQTERTISLLSFEVQRL